jgi:UV DNA damage endonuclease
MLDYSSRQKGGRPGQHVETIDVRDFKKLIKNTNGFDCDIMLEIKDKEKSTLKAIKAISKNPLFVRRDYFSAHYHSPQYYFSEKGMNYDDR